MLPAIGQSGGDRLGLDLHHCSSLRFGACSEVGVGTGEETGRGRGTRQRGLQYSGLSRYRPDLLLLAEYATLTNVSKTETYTLTLYHEFDAQNHRISLEIS